MAIFQPLSVLSALFCIGILGNGFRFSDCLVKGSLEASLSGYITACRILNNTCLKPEGKASAQRAHLPALRFSRPVRSHPCMDNGQLNGCRGDQRYPERNVSPQGPPPYYDENESDDHTDGGFFPVGFQVGTESWK